MTAPLAAYPGLVFGRAGLVLHGETEVRKRKDLVRQFQQDERVPFFVLSVKAGGTGLNLTAASMSSISTGVDPAVENQATDPPFRIGQNKMCLCTSSSAAALVEDRIDQMIGQSSNWLGFSQRRC